MALNEKNLKEYIQNSKTIVLATVDENDNPNLRTLGGYNFKNYTLYFGTSNKSNKVNQIEKNNNVSVLIQHENQTIPNFVNVTIYGKAQKVQGDEYLEAADIIRKRRPNLTFQENEKSIFKVEANKIKILDFSEEPENQIKIIEF